MRENQQFENHHFQPFFDNIEVGNIVRIKERNI